MNSEEIINNKLIAEFMGIYYDTGLEPAYYVKNNKIIQFEDLQYHCDWNWLMDVVETIEILETEQDGYFGVHISSNGCSIQGTNLWKSIKDFSGYGPVYISDPNAIFETKLESTYYNVVEFIKWWGNRNENK